MLTGKQIVWFYVRRTDANNNRLLSLAYRRTSGKYADRYLPRQGSPITGNIAASAIRGDALHAIFSDGSHWSFEPVENVIPGLGIRRLRGVNLPQSAVPLTMTTDQVSGELYALIPDATVLQFMTGATGASQGDGATHDADEPPADRDTPSAAEIAAAEDGTEKTKIPAAAIVRFERGNWLFDRSAPEGMVAHQGWFALWSRGGELYIATRRDERSTVYHHCPDNMSPWSPPVVIPHDGACVLQSIWMNDAPTLITGRETDGGLFLEPIVMGPQKWTKRPALTLDRFAGRVGTCEWALGMIGDTMFAATPGSDDGLRVGLWSAKRQSVVEPLHDVGSFDGPMSIEPHPRTRQLLEYALLAAGLALVFIWRRDVITRVPSLGAGTQLAQLPRRTSAIAVDLVLLAPVWMFVLYVLWQPDPKGAGFMEQILVSPPAELYWGSAIVGGIVGLYGFFMESVLGFTVGKRMCHLVVLRDDGQRAGVGTCLVRNLARIVEFHFPPLILLVAMTPGRQRLGDLLARTVVIEQNPQKPGAPPPGAVEDTPEDEDSA